MNATSRDALHFVAHLKNEGSDLLDFRYREADPYQAIKSMLFARDLIDS